MLFQILLAIVLLAIVYNVPSYFEHVVDLEPDLCRSREMMTLKYSELRQSPLYFVVYKTVIYFVFRFLLPLITLTILNGRLLMTLRRQNNYLGDQHTKEQPRQSSSPDGTAKRVNFSIVHTTVAHQRRQECFRLRRFSRSDDPSVTALVVGMVSLFIVCQMPDLLLRLWVTYGQLKTLAFDVPQQTSFTSWSSTESSAAESTATMTASLFAWLTTNGTINGLKEHARTEDGQFVTPVIFSGTPHSEIDQQSDETGGGSSLVVWYLNTATNALLTLNSSANCFVYCFSGRRFRQQLRQLLSCRRRSERRTNGSADQYLQRRRTRRPAIAGRLFSNSSSSHIVYQNHQGVEHRIVGSVEAAGAMEEFPSYSNRRVVQKISVGNSSNCNASINTAKTSVAE